MSGRIGELLSEVREFFEDGIKAVRKVRGDDAKVVFLFDSLEQIRGSLSNEHEVTHSVEVLFSTHIKSLEIPYVHVVYTVPPWLKFVLPGLSMFVLPCLRLWNNDSGRSECASGESAPFRAVPRGQSFDIESNAFSEGDSAHEHIDLRDPSRKGCLRSQPVDRRLEPGPGRPETGYRASARHLRRRDIQPKLIELAASLIVSVTSSVTSAMIVSKLQELAAKRKLKVHVEAQPVSAIKPKSASFLNPESGRQRARRPVP